MRKFENAGINSQTGLPIANPTITVYHADGVTVATIYSDEGSTAKPNPFTGDAQGRFNFYAPDGDYVVKIGGAGVTDYSIQDVTVGDPKRAQGVVESRTLLMANAYYDQRTTNFDRRSTGTAAWAIELDAVSDYMRILRAASGANPITWTELLRLSSAGHLLFGTDNTQDIGASGASRPSTGFFASSVRIGGSTVGTLGIRSGGETSIYIASAGGGGRRYALITNPSYAPDEFSIFDDIAAAARWRMDTSGHWLSHSDNALDIGRAANRLRDLYVGTSVIVGNPAAGGENAQLQGTGRLVLDAGDSVFPYAIADFTNDAGVQSRLAIPSGGGIEIDATGTGSHHKISVSGGGDIHWGKPLVALGGGAAPTFGTIGASGPATAAQFGWLRFVDSAGTLGFIPTWR